MPQITLPDGKVLAFDRPVSGAEIAAAIGPGLAKAALAFRVDGKLKDLSHTLATDAPIQIVTAKDADAPFPALSTAEHTTFVVPTAKVEPEAGAQATGRGPSMASTAVGVGQVTGVPAAPAASATIPAGSPAIAGADWSGSPPNADQSPAVSSV